jgi:hypothetical protein
VGHIFVPIMFWIERAWQPALLLHLQAQGGLAVVPSDAFAVGGAEQAPNAVRISLSLEAASSRSTLQTALQLLATSVASERLAFSSEVV